MHCSSPIQRTRVLFITIHEYVDFAFSNCLDINVYVGKLSEQHFNVCLFSNPGVKTVLKNKIALVLILLATDMYCNPSYLIISKTNKNKGKNQNCHSVLNGSLWFLLVLFLVLYFFVSCHISSSRAASRKDFVL